MPNNKAKSIAETLKSQLEDTEFVQSCGALAVIRSNRRKALDDLRSACTSALQNPTEAALNNLIAACDSLKEINAVAEAYHDNH